MGLIDDFLIQVVVEALIFFILVFIGMFAYNKLKNSSSKLLNPQEYFPDEEIHSLRQVFILIMMGLFFINILYSLTFTDNDLIYFAIYDILLSLYVAIKLDKSSLKNKVFVVLLIPFGALTYMIFGNSLVGILDLIHVPVYIYLMKVYYDKFRQYTESNGLGLTIILLFAMIFISFLFTQVVEDVNPLDSLVMVSNAFTSNGYAVLGHSIPGKLNALILVWGGYLLSGVGTATLTAAILMAHFNKRLDELEELIKKNNDD